MFGRRTSSKGIFFQKCRFWDRMDCFLEYFASLSLSAEAFALISRSATPCRQYRTFDIHTFLSKLVCFVQFWTHSKSSTVPPYGHIIRPFSTFCPSSKGYDHGLPSCSVFGRVGLIAPVGKTSVKRTEVSRNLDNAKYTILVPIGEVSFSTSLSGPGSGGFHDGLCLTGPDVKGAWSPSTTECC